MIGLARYGLIALVVFLAAFPGYAREERRILGVNWSLSTEFWSSYVDNAIRLSDADINRFQDGTQSFESPLQTYDDWKNELVIQPRLRFRLPQRQRLDIAYSFKAALFLRNDFLNYQTHTLNLYLRPMSSRYLWLLNFRIFTIPSYYLRQHYDRDTQAFHAARFQSWQYRFAPRFRFWKPLWIELRGEIETTYYNSKFTEYDSEMNSLGVRAEYRNPLPMSLALSYLRNRSENIGYEQTGASGWGLVDLPGIETEYGDASFDEDEFQAEVSGRIAVIASVPLNGSVDWQLRRRIYTTERSLDEDPFHRGRLDLRWKLAPSLTTALTPRVDLTLGFSYEERTTTSDISRVEEIKSFKVRQVFGAVEYRFE
jgi:hypothetical protein